MSSASDTGHGDLSGWEQTEAAILAAGNFITPSRDLRPRVLDAARETVAVQRTKRNFRGFVLSAACLCAISMPIVDYLVLLRTQWTAPSATEMERRALEISRDTFAGPTWGLMEAFDQLRRQQAAHLGHTFPKQLPH